MKNEKVLKPVAGCLLIFFVCFLSVRYSSQSLSVLSYLVFKSAQGYLPVSSFEFSEEDKPTEEAAAFENTTSQVPTEKESESTACEEEKTTEKKQEAETEKELLILPEDIKKLMKSEAQKGKNDKKTGSIKEKQYTSEGVTDKEGVVRMKNTNKTKVNIKELLSEDLSFKVNKEEPAVLIFHTHTTESYQYIDRNFFSSSYTTRNTNADRNMVRIGKAIKNEIEKEGFKVIHDTTIHDTKYTGAYGRSRKTVESYLKKYPSIQIVLDVHRDGIADYDGSKIKPTAVIDGKKVAQVMIISGCQEEGNGITGYESWKENLSFALKLQKEMEETFPGLTRPIFFCGRKYNMDMTKASLLLEVGSDSNTIEEAYYSGICIGKSLSQLLERVTE